jgi:hypothetical protein
MWKSKEIRDYRTITDEVKFNKSGVPKDHPFRDREFKGAFGTGAVRLNSKTAEADLVGGVLYTIKDGIIYDAKQLLKDVEMMVKKQKKEVD